MSTQDSNSSVPISIATQHEQSHFRLLELPADILSILTSDNAPILQLKSRETEDEDEPKDANVVLCTADKTYQIRQVSTSNSVYVTRPCEAPSTEPLGLSRLGIQAICKCDSTIELLSGPVVSAAAHIRTTLPVFLSTGKYSSQRFISRDQLFDSIPLSQAECEQGWTELSCFESTDPAGCFAPSAKVRAQVWQAVLTTATAAGIDLTIAYPDVGLPHYLSELEIDWPRDLLAAVLRSVSVRDIDGDLAVNEERCVRFVGLNQLESQSEGRVIRTESLLQNWKNLVPEKWRDKCQLSILQGHYTLSDNGDSITFKSNIEDTAHAASSGKTSLGAKRKWHEKFRASKRS